jgi:hypothetical protein
VITQLINHHHHHGALPKLEAIGKQVPISRIDLECVFALAHPQPEHQWEQQQLGIQPNFVTQCYIGLENIVDVLKWQFDSNCVLKAKFFSYESHARGRRW